MHSILHSHHDSPLAATSLSLLASHSTTAGAAGQALSFDLPVSLSRYSKKKMIHRSHISDVPISYFKTKPLNDLIAGSFGAEWKREKETISRKVLSAAGIPMTWVRSEKKRDGSRIHIAACKLCKDLKAQLHPVSPRGLHVVQKNWRE